MPMSMEDASIQALQADRVVTPGSELHSMRPPRLARARRRVVLGQGAAWAGVLTAAVGCAPGESRGGPDRSMLAGTLTYMDWRLGNSPIDEVWYNAMRDGFLAKVPSAKWEQQQVPWGPTYVEKVVAQAVGGTPPDVIFVDARWGRDWWVDGLLEDLGPYTAKFPSVAPGQYVESAQAMATWKGKSFGIPHTGPDFNVFYVNRKLLQEAGINASESALDAWTWDNLIETNQKIARRDADGKLARIGVHTGGSSWANWVVWTYSNGGAFYNKDLTAVAFNDRKGEQALQWILDLQNRHKTTETPEGFDLNRGLLDGAVPARFWGSWNQRQLLNDPAAQSLDYTWLNIPRGPAGTKQAGMAWSLFSSMSRGGKNKDLAWAFLEYYHSLPVAVQQFQIWKQVSPRKDFLEGPQFKEASRTSPSYAKYRRFGESGGVLPYVKFSEVDAQLVPVFREVMAGQRTVRDGLAEMERLANQIVSRAT
jgi:ABC-type glycerol-3-phosphate transport system substrate-binding protein